MNIHERVLHDVFGLLGRPTDHRRNPQRRMLMSPHQFTERQPIILASAREQCIIVAFGQIR